MDFNDMASDQELKYNSIAIATIRARAALPSVFTYTGYCYNCSEALDPPVFFCNKDCSDDFIKRTENNKRNKL